MAETPKHKLYITHGDCFRLSLIYKASGQIVNLSGASAEICIAWPATYHPKRPPIGAGSIVSQGKVIPDQGRIDFEVDGSVTAGIPAIDGVAYQVRLQNAACQNTLLAGPVHVAGSLFGA